jgi:hypothetical protein
MALERNQTSSEMENYSRLDSPPEAQHRIVDTFGHFVIPLLINDDYVGTGVWSRSTILLGF